MASKGKKISVELSKKRGDNVKKLLKQYGWTQGQLAKELRIAPTNLNAKLNGSRTLTDYDAELIAKLFPPVRAEWIMGTERFPTQGQDNWEVIQQARQEGELLNLGFCAFASLVGYTVSPPQITADEPMSSEEALSAIQKGFTISIGEECISLSIEEMNRLQNKICDHIKNELDYLFKERTEQNGKA